MIPPVIAIDPKGVNKIDRLLAVSTLFEGGMVYLPEQAEWLLDFEMELFGFPLVTHDDQVDSTSQYLRWAYSYRTLIDHHALGNYRSALADNQLNTGDEMDLGVSHSRDMGGFI